VTTFEDHTLWHPDCNTNNIYITSQQDLIISYCKQARSDLGSINVSSILDGSSLARIVAREDSTEEQLALEDVTALFYNEDRNEIYTGNKDGRVHIWSNDGVPPVKLPAASKALLGAGPANQVPRPGGSRDRSSNSEVGAGSEAGGVAARSSTGRGWIGESGGARE
jgi:hypothetical protein